MDSDDVEDLPVALGIGYFDVVVSITIAVPTTLTL
jgi:hypothetical protein